MKKLIIILAVVMIGFTISCGEKKAEIEKANNESVYLIEPMELPDWYYDEDVVIKKDNNNNLEFIYFKASRDALHERSAINMADFDIRGVVANSIHNIVSVEKIIATENSDEYYAMRVATISREIDTSALFPAGRIIEYIVIKNPGEETLRFYRATVRYRMLYDMFSNRIIEAVSKTDKDLVKDGKKPIDNEIIRERLMQLGQ
jgi:hypothetical protein